MNFDRLVHNISIVEQVILNEVVHAINISLTTRNWILGYYIVEFEQNGEDRAVYGENLLKKLEQRLQKKGLTERRFREFRKFYLTYPQLEAEIRLYVGTNLKQEIRQIASAESYNANNHDDMIRRTASAELEQWQTDPHSNVVMENDLENAILEHLQHFLLELGDGFCYEATQKRILIDDEYFKVDLVFYHRILHCHVLVELKTDKFRHEYASQLNLYLNYYKNEVMQPADNPPVGLLLCTDYGETTVQYATAGLDENLFVSKYLVNLPSVGEIKKYLIKINKQ